MPVSSKHARYVSSVADPAAHADLKTALRKASQSERLALACAVARAAQASGAAEARPAWRLAVDALHSLAPALAVASTNTKSEPAANIDVYSALYALAVAEDPCASSEEAKHGQRIAAETLRKSLSNAVRPRRGRPRSGVSASELEDLSLLDRTLFVGAAAIGWTRLLPAAGAAANVVVPALLARIRSRSAPILERLSVARALLRPWLKALDSARVIDAYQKKARAALMHSEEGADCSPADKLRLRVASVSLFPVSAHEFARTVHKAANAFLRGERERDYAFVASVYEDAVPVFMRAVDDDVYNNDTICANEDICAWFDHVLVTYSSADSSRYQGMACELVASRDRLLEGSKYGAVALAQQQLVQGGLYARNVQSYEGRVSFVARATQYLEEAFESAQETGRRRNEASESAATSDGAAELRALRVLEPVRAKMCADRARTSTVDKSAFDMLSLYVRLVLRARNLSHSESFVQSRIISMIPAAMGTCEILLRVCSCSCNVKGMNAVLHDCLALARDIRTVSSSKETSQWAKWLSVMLKNQGVDLYNSHSKAASEQDKMMMEQAAVLMETGAKWQVLMGVSPAESDSLDSRSCWCGVIPSFVLTSYAKRLAFAADAYIAAGSRFYGNALRVALEALHACSSSNAEAPCEVVEAFSRATSSVASSSSDAFWSAVEAHCLAVAETSTLLLSAFSAIQLYLWSRRRRAPMKQDEPSSSRRHLTDKALRTLLRDIGEKLLSGSCIKNLPMVGYVLARLETIDGSIAGLEAASRLAKQLSRRSGGQEGTSSEFYAYLSRFWLSLEGLDPSQVQNSIQALEMVIDRQGDSARLFHCSLWVSRLYHVLEVAEWGAYVFTLQDMDEVALSVYHLAEKVSHMLGLHWRRSLVAEACRRLGLFDRCRALIGQDANSMQGDCAAVYGRVLVDLCRFEDAEVVADRHLEPESFEVVADAALLGRGDVMTAFDKTKAAVKTLATWLRTHDTSEFSELSSVHIAGVCVDTVAGVLDESGRLRHTSLIALATCISRLACLHVRVGSLRDAHYFASKSCEVARSLSSPSVSLKLWLVASTVPQRVLLPFEADGQCFGRTDALDEYPGQFDDTDSVNLVTAIRVRIFQGDEALERVSSCLECPPDIRDALTLYDEAGALLNRLDSYEGVNPELVASLWAQLHRRRGQAHLFERNIPAARESFTHARCFPGHCREDELANLLGLAQCHLECDEFGHGMELVEQALKIVEDRPVASCRLTRKLWRIAADLKINEGMRTGSLDSLYVVRALLNAHGTALGLRTAVLKARSCIRSQVSDLSDALSSISLADRASGEPNLSLEETSSDGARALQALLPVPSVLVGLTLSSDGRDLIIWRITCTESSLASGVVRRSIPSEGPLSLRAVEERFNQILLEMKQMAVGENILSREEKSAWWRKRFALDHDLGRLMAELEETWLGPARSLLLPAVFTRNASSGLAAYGMTDDLVRVDNSLASGAVASMLQYPEIVSASEVSALVRKVQGKQSSRDTDTGLDNLLKDISNLSRQEATSTRMRARRPSTRRTKGTARSDIRYLKGCTTSCQLYLAVGTDLERLPWECIPILRSSKSATSRIPHMSFLSVDESKLLVDASKVFYLLNPSGDLDSTQRTFQSCFEGRDGWEGVSGGEPEARDVSSNVSSMESNDVFIYCGHGGGETYVPPRRLSRASSVPVSILMGCSSGRLERFSGDAESDGTPYEYLLAGAPAVVANLWDVSDRDIDRLTSDLLTRWLPAAGESPGVEAAAPDRGNKYEKAALLSGHEENESDQQHQSLALALSHARDACRLPYLVGAATVVYGRGDIYSIRK